jgi:hypothetical protein
VIKLSRKAALGVFGLAAVVTAALTFPGDYSPTKPGLDPSWEWGLNYFSEVGTRFGRDLIFTYGPLGYLLHPLSVGSHVGQGLALRLLVSAAMFGCLIVLTLRRSSVVSGLLFLSGYLVLASFWLEFDYQLLAAAAFMLAVGIETRRTAVLIAPTIVCGALIFMKFGSGLSAALVAFASCGVWWWSWRTTRGAIIVAVTYVVTVLAFGLLLLGSIPALIEFCRLSFQIAHGYNDAMSVDGQARPVIGGLTVIAGFAAVTWLMSSRRAASAKILLLLLLPVFLSFKHSFVRQDWGHEAFVFGLVLTGLVLALAFAVDGRERWALTLGTVAAVGVFWLTEADWPVRGRIETFKTIVNGSAGRAQIGSLVRLRDTETGLQQGAAAALEASDKLPPDWLERIGQRSVLVIPSEIALCAANNLRCQPYPTMQMYITYTQELDRWTANEIRRHPPEYIIAEVLAIDGRNMVWDCPETWLALTAGWEVVGLGGSPSRLLLKQRNEPVGISEVLLAQDQARVDAWIEAPATEGLLRLSLDTHERLVGRVRRLLFRSEPISLQLRYGSGRLASFRLVLDTARSGILINPMVTNLRRLAELFDWRTAGSPVRAVRLVGPATRWMEPEFSVRWTAAMPSFPLGSLPPDGVPPALSSEPALVTIDTVNGESAATRTLPITSKEHQDLTVSGWAVDKAVEGAAGDVYLQIDDGALEIEADYGGERADVAKYFSQPGYRFSGFNGTIEASLLQHGHHKLRIRVVSLDGRRTALSDSLPIDVR